MKNKFVKAYLLYQLSFFITTISLGQIVPPSQSFRRTKPMSYEEMMYVPNLKQNQYNEAKQYLNNLLKKINDVYLTTSDPIVEEYLKNIYNQLIKYYNVDLADRTVIQELILIEKRIESQLNYRNLSLYPKEEVFSCDELIVFLKSNGEIIKTLSSYHLSSSWLNRVTGYIYEGNIYAIAEIKDSEWPYKIKSYIFCNISESNWSNFDNIYINGSYGERFHKFIFDYQCNCE